MHHSDAGRPTAWRRSLSGWDESLCRRLNTGNRNLHAARFFAGVSRLGDGAVWYAVMLMQPVLLGWEAGWRMLLLMAATGAFSTALYRLIKGRTRRPRPSEALQALTLTVSPLDRFSFPSGHTLHAVGFTVMATAATPWLGWLLVPYAALVGLSRPILGLHWPSDVLVGAGLGALMGWTALACAPWLGLAA